jgi:lipoyl-dependent peroxiredoxin
VPRIERTAEIEWEGNLARGQGSISAGSSGAFSGLEYSAATRVGRPEGKSSPEELLAAAHGACFTMSLAGELTKRGTPPDRLDVVCRIVMDEVAGGGHQVIGSELTVRATVPGIDNETFDETVHLADEGCPLGSMLKRSGADVSIAAALA